MADFSAFHDVRFPTAISFGASGGPEWRNEIVALTSGREKRNARLAASRRRYDVGTGVRTLADIEEVMGFFEARRGSLHAFRLRDPFDMKSSAIAATPTMHDQSLGVGDGVTLRFPLQKNYSAGADTLSRRIALPVAGTLQVAVGGAASAAGFDASRSEIVLTTAPALGQHVTAGFEFDVPVRFDIDHLAVNLTSFKAGQIPSIPLVEVLL